jgi:hypothetical protein
MNVIEIEKDEDEFEDELNQVYGTVEICGEVFDQGTAIRELDPTWFRCSLADCPTTYQCGECNENHGEDQDAAEECCKVEELNEADKDRFDTQEGVL